MKNTSKRKLICSIIILLLVICALCGISFAIYTSQVYQRAVIRNRDTETVRFSSDKLYRVVYDSTKPRVYYYPVNSGQKSMSFSVCNYDQKKNTVVNQHKIEYDVEFKFDNITDGFEYKINGYTLSNENTLTLSSSLSGNRRSADIYEIEFSEKDYNNLKVTVKVIPKDLSLTKNNILYATLIPIEFATTQGVSFEWEFTDDKTYSFDEVDAFNITMSISGGEDEIIVGWNNNMLDIDPFFKEKIKAAGGTYSENGNNSSLSFIMNSEDETSNYHFQFYQHDGRPSDWKNWRDLPISITRAKAQSQ